MPHTERQMCTAIIIPEILIRTEMQLGDNPDIMYTFLTYQVYVISVSRLVDDDVDMILPAEAAHVINVPLCHTLHIR